MEVHERLASAHCALSAAVPGSAIHWTSAPPTASGTPPTAGASILVSGWPERYGQEGCDSGQEDNGKHVRGHVRCLSAAGDTATCSQAVRLSVTCIIDAARWRQG